MGFPSTGRLAPLVSAMAACASVAGGGSGAATSPADDGASGRALYLKHCAGCHGKNLDGASASALVKRGWAYGRDEFSIGNVIRHGIPSSGMPAFGSILSEQEQKDVLSHILKAQTSPPGVAEPLPATIETKEYRLKVETRIAAGLDTPWGIEFIDARHALISEQSGKLFWMVDGVIDPTPISGLPPVDRATSTGGLFDVAIDPGHAANGWVYLALAYSRDPGDARSGGMTRVIRGRIRGHLWYDTQYLFRTPAAFDLPASSHWGGRMLFDKAGDLLFSIGDMGQPEDSQDLSKPAGKVFRIRTDAPLPPTDAPSGYPIRSIVFSYGNRNVQGLAQHPETGEIWASEHGPFGGDELNILRTGRNYGWPIVSYGVNYDGSVISEDPERPGIEKPVRYWTPAPAPAVSGMDFVTGDLFSKWRNDLILGSLSHEKLFRFVIRGNEIADEELLFSGYGRIRDVKMGPDGALYLALNGPGAIVRLTPVGAR